MGASSFGEAMHPHFVAIPDPQRDAEAGVRAYREPAAPHPLQIRFLEPAGERAWTESLGDLLSAGRAAEAEARLAQELAGFDGSLARLCKRTAADDVSLEGWEDLLSILAEWEGPPITAITLGLTNPPDLVFEPGRTQEPELLLGLYSDEAFSFSTASNDELLAECSRDLPAWVGHEEDVEFYCSMSGLAELNTALVHSKHRHFLRDGRDGVEGRAPGGYVEFILGSWLLATRFLQAAERAIADHGLPSGCRLISGTVEINADFVTIVGSSQRAARPVNRSFEPSFASLSMKPWVRREDTPADAPLAHQSLRQRLVTDEPDINGEPSTGLLSRLFRRLRGMRKAR